MTTGLDEDAVTTAPEVDAAATDVALVELRKRYGEVAAVDSVDLEIARACALARARAAPLAA